MELSEAKERISQLIAYGEMLIDGIDENDCENTRKAIEAWNTIKKALDNSISKEYHEMVVKEQNDIINDLKSRVDNSISKDKVRKKIDELELLKKALPIRTEIPRFIDYLKELLGEE